MPLLTCNPALKAGFFLSFTMQMYFIALVLPSELNKKILQYKLWMEEKYGCKVGLKSPAHITILPPFWMNEQNEKQLISDLDSLANEQQSFSIATNNLAAFKPRTIFLAVSPNKTLDEIKQASDKYFTNKLLYKMKFDSRPFHPHITIATRDLHKKAFHEAWPYFENKEFLETWQANGISLLRHNKKNWDVIHTSQFKNL